MSALPFAPSHSNSAGKLPAKASAKDDTLEQDLEAINKTTQEILEKSDRVRAVLLGVQLDRLLQMLLKTYLVPFAGKKDPLLSGSGFAGTFSARIELGYRVGLLPPDWHHDLKIINQIRDDFAHGLAGLHLNQPKFASLCNMLKLSADWQSHLPESKPSDINPQTRFVAACVVLSAHLCIARTKVERMPNVWTNYSFDAVTVDRPESNQ